MKPALTLTLWALLGLFFGISGISRVKLEEDLQALQAKKDELSKKQIKLELDGVPFTDEYSYEYYTTINPYVSLFPWFFKVPSIIGIISTAMSFGLLGAIGNIILLLTKKEITINEAKVWSNPILGIFIGIAVLGLSYILPNLLVVNSGTIRPFTLMFLAFFCGLFSQRFLEILSNFFSKFFKS